MDKYLLIYNNQVISKGETIKEVFQSVFEIQVINANSSLFVEILHAGELIISLRHSYSLEWSKEEIKSDVMRNITNIMRHITNIEFVKVV